MRARDYLKLLEPAQQKVMKKQMKRLAEKRVRFNKDGFTLKLNSKIGRYKLGEFEVVVRRDCDDNDFDLDTPIVELNSLENNYEYPHPHISNGIPCLWQFYFYIKEAVDSGDYLHTIELIQKFLNSADDDRAFVPLKEIINKCKKCKSPIYGCFCDEDY